MTRFASVALLGTAVLLCLAVAVEVSGLGSGPSGDLPKRAVAPPLADRTAPKLPDERAAWLKEILARPLFSPDRRPVESGIRGLPRLAGVVITGAQRVAIFAGQSKDHPIVAEAGTHVGAYEVRSIEDDGVTVSGPQGTSLIRPAFDLYRPPPPSSAPAPLARPVLPVRPGQPIRPAAS